MAMRIKCLKKRLPETASPLIFNLPTGSMDIYAAGCFCIPACYKTQFLRICRK